MKKVLKKTMAAAAMAVVSANAYSLWNLEDGQGSLALLGAGTQGGAMYAYDDSDNGGTSTVELPPASTTIDVFGPWLQDNGGRIVFETTADYKYSFAGIGFNWLDPEGVWNPMTESNGSSDGITVCYKSEKPMIVDLKTRPGDEFEYDNYTYTLPVATSPKHQQIRWSQFSQAGWGEKQVDINAFMTYSAGIQFKFEGAGTASRNVFYMGGLGWYNDSDNCNTQLTPILTKGKSFNFGLIQNNRVLSFSGLNKATTVEVINMQGKLLSRTVVDNEKQLNLTNLPAGVYMIRAESLNFIQKVMLK